MVTPVKQTVGNETLLRSTRSLCPECGGVVDAQVLIRDGTVTMRKCCPNHGWHEALVSSDASWHSQSLKYDKPGARPQDFAMPVEHGCPFDCGLCPEHLQHTCVGVIEITTRCNLACPICFADSGAAGPDGGYDLGLAQVEAILDRLLETEGQPEVVQISGGEPTTHPELLDILAAAKARDIRHVMLDTNGLRMAHDREFVHRLARYDPLVYLQFDGLTSATHELLRGQDLRVVKEQALHHLSCAGVFVILVPTIVRGVNESEIGDILCFGLEHPAVVGVNYQPATFAGRYLNHRHPFELVTLPDVLHALEEQTQGLFQVSDFFPVPCPDPTCSACTYAFIDGDRVIPIPRILNVNDYLDLIANRTLPDPSAEIQPALESLWSMAAVMGSTAATENLMRAACGLEIPENLDPADLREHFFGIQVHGFMDEHTFDVKRVMKCCVHQLLPDGRAVPFCAYNNLGYREELRRTLGSSPISRPRPEEMLA